AISAVGFLAERRTAGPPESDLTDSASPRPALMERLPMKFRDAALFAASSEDHYVRVHTSAGSHLVLMRLADVGALARPVDGLNPHRSWWVAKDGVAEVAREGGKRVIVLKDGARAPVSRAGLKRLREAGWF
ncbi:MAG: LytTR family DNA-binding domain-containing protein, partial [Litorimonas sp.]